TSRSAPATPSASNGALLTITMRGMAVSVAPGRPKALTRPTVHDVDPHGSVGQRAKRAWGRFHFSTAARVGPLGDLERQRLRAPATRDAELDLRTHLQALAHALEAACSFASERDDHVAHQQASTRGGAVIGHCR